MRRRAVDLELALTHDEFQGLKRLRKAPVDFREAPFIVEEVFVRQIVEKVPSPEIRVGVVLRVDESVDDVEAAFRRELLAQS
jgi:hypothetical protein